MVLLCINLNWLKCWYAEVENFFTFLKELCIVDKNMSSLKEVSHLSFISWINSALSALMLKYVFLLPLLPIPMSWHSRIYKRINNIFWVMICWSFFFKLKCNKKLHGTSHLICICSILRISPLLPRMSPIIITPLFTQEGSLHEITLELNHNGIDNRDSVP